MATVSVNPPKTPVTKGSNTLATATVPNVCKMPGPPAPFVPTPLPNIGQGGKSPQGYSTTVQIEGNDVAIQGASFGSSGDIASQGTGGGIVSNNAEGQTTFAAPGSMDVKIEGKNVQLLGDQMLNNNGPSGSPPNAACMMGALHAPGTPGTPEAIVACAIQCCDKKPYKLPKKGRPDAIACQRLACRKHSCVFHALKEKNDPRIKPSPKYTPSQVPGLSQNRIPDIHIPGPGAGFPSGKIIDAKFPCETSRIVKPTGPGYGNSVLVTSMPASGRSLVSAQGKENLDYKMIASKVEPMSPKDAEDQYPCDCKK
jgi:uncharacterized Zn-binding protein involved in type VI secretion